MWRYSLKPQWLVCPLLWSIVIEAVYCTIGRRGSNRDKVRIRWSSLKASLQSDRHYQDHLGFQTESKNFLSPTQTFASTLWRRRVCWKQGFCPLTVKRSTLLYTRFLYIKYWCLGLAADNPKATQICLVKDLHTVILIFGSLGHFHLR